MKKILVISGIIISILILVTFAYLINIGNSIKEGAPHISETIKDSKEVDAFVTEYKLDSVSSFMADSLKKYGLSRINFSTLEYWIEKKWGVKYKYLFFEQINYSKDYRLHVTDPTSLKIQNGHPFIGFKIKNSSKYSGDNGMGGTVCIINIDSIPDTIDLEIHLAIDHSNNKYIGDIRLKKN